MGYVDDKKLSRGQLYRILQEEGLRCGDSSFARHMRKCRERS